VYPTANGLPFLGWRLFRDHRRLKRENVREFSRRLREQVAAYHAGALTLDQLTLSTRAWIAHASHGDTWRLRARLFADMPLSLPA
jgi:hypothetical protein